MKAEDKVERMAKHMNAGKTINGREIDTVFTLKHSKSWHVCPNPKAKRSLDTRARWFV